MSSPSSELSLVGSEPGPMQQCNVFDFMFSNPYTKDGHVVRNAPTQKDKQHFIPPIPPERPLLVDPVTGASVSWSRTRRDALRIAAGLHGLGLHPAPSPPSSSSSSEPIISPTVLMHLPNCLPFAPILFGIFASGLTATMANPALTSGELAWILQNAEPHAVITSPQGYSVLSKAIAECSTKSVADELLRQHRIYIVDPSADDYGSPSPASSAGGLPPGTQDWKALLAPNPLPSAVQISATEVPRRTAVILWSSGTSGKSKGVVLSHRMLVGNNYGYWHGNPQFGRTHRWLGFAPFYHVFALSYILVIAPCLGATIFVMPKFDPRAMLEHVQRYRITFLHMAPPVGVLLAKSDMLGAYDVSSLKGGVSGGAPFPPEILEAVYRRLGILIKLGYGLSEAGSVCNQFGDSWEDLKPQLGNTGAPMYGVQLRIVAVDDGKRVLPKGAEGEILIKSPMLMNCYLKNEEATREALDDEGWFHTGDVGKVDGNGFLWITDRLKEVIKVKGFQVSPSELDNILCGSTAVADAACTGIFDAALASEFPRAYVVPSDKKLVAQCSGKNMRVTPELKALAEELAKLVESKTVGYKWLRGGIVFTPQVPKSPSGKILRRMLKDTSGVEVGVYGQKAWQQVEKAKL